MYTIWSGNLGLSMQPSLPFVLQGERVSLDFQIDVAAGASGKVQFYLEYGQTPTADWYREVAEENNGNGDVQMPAVVRTLTDENGADLAGGLNGATYNFSAQFIRSHMLGRIQIRSTANGFVARVRTITGLAAIAPSFAPIPTLQPAQQPYLP